MEEPCGNPRKPETLPLEQVRFLLMRPRSVVITLYPAPGRGRCRSSSTIPNPIPNPIPSPISNPIPSPIPKQVCEALVMQLKQQVIIQRRLQQRVNDRGVSPEP